MSLELGIRLPGSAGELDVQRVLHDLSRLVDLLGLLEDAQLRKDRKPISRSTWSFSALSLGSVNAVIAPLEPRGGASFEVLDHLPELCVAGFEDVESSPRVPRGWDTRALRVAEKATRNLGTDASRAMLLTLLVDNQPRDLAFDQIGRDVRVKRDVIHCQSRDPSPPRLIQKVQEVFQLTGFIKELVSGVELAIPDRLSAPLLGLLFQ